MIIIKKTFRWILYAILLVLSLMVIAAAVIRFAIFPNIDNYKNDISTKITEKIGLKTTIGNIITGWDGVSPQIVISEIDIYDAEDNSALHLENVKGTFSWLSVPMLNPHLSYISVSNPKLTVHRKENGSIYVAGIAMAGEGEPDFPNWILSQSHIRIKNAAIIWQDDLRQAPPLSLNNVYFRLQNPAWRQIFGQHLFSVSAQPSTGSESPIKMDGSFFGRDVTEIETWHGTANLEMPEMDFTAWKDWVDYPIELQSGDGKANVSLSFSNKRINKIAADVELHNLVGRLDQDKQPFNANTLSGFVSWEKAKKATTVTAKNIQLNAENELNIEGGSGFVSYTERNKKPWVNASLKLNTFNLSFLQKIKQLIAIPTNISKPLNTLSPQGTLNALSVSLQGDPKKPSHYRISSDFNGLGIKAYNNIPGFNNLSGKIDADEDNGTLTLASTKAELDLKDVLRWPIPARELNGKITWSNKGRLKIVANDLYIANAHIHGTLNANYDMNGVKGGRLNLSGKFDNGNAKFAPFYYPMIMGKETMDWLDSSIISGKANNVELTVKGNLEDFPYVDKQNKPDPSLGTFKVTSRINDAVLEYGESWPKIEGLGLDMLFEGNSMVLTADKGKIYGVDIVKGSAIIPQLNTYGANAQVLKIEATGKGPTADGIKFINTSPVKEVALGFTDDLKTAGNGQLELSLNLPLNHIVDSTYKGEYSINNGTMFANERMGLPEISAINGKLSFNTKGINAQNINAEILGGPVQLNLNTASDQTISIDATGTMTDEGVKQFTQNQFTAALDGQTDWTASIAIKKPLMNLSIRSDLKGLAIDLPMPIGKSAAQETSLIVTKKQTLAAQDVFELSYNDVVSAIILRNEKNGDLIFDRGDIGINTNAKLPAELGLSLHGEFDYVNADEWLALTDNTSTESAPNQASTPAFSLKKADISIQQLDLFNRTINDIKITSSPSEGPLKASISSNVIEGDIEWQQPSKTNETGKIIAKLQRLHIPSSNNEEEPTEKDIKRLDKKYPALDITAQDFKLGAKELGLLELKAFEMDEDWVIEQLKISNPDNVLFAEGRWHNWTRNPNTNLEFSLSANDVGKTFKRFGQPDVIKGGVALISGHLQWPGSPHQFKKAGLNGEFRLGVSKGQVLKVQPGVGRLFGLLTLQSLPRRLTLDFRDLFSEGFAFDVISATAKIDNGVMKSDDFFMTGPAAETEIKGETDLNAETQNLEVKVVPHISDTVSLAALAGGPIAGAAAFVAQKLLKDPLNKIAQSEYRITGTWDNPIEADAEKESAEKKQAPSPLNAQ